MLSNVAALKNVDLMRPMKKKMIRIPDNRTRIYAALIYSNQRSVNMTCRLIMMTFLSTRDRSSMSMVWPNTTRRWT